MFEYKIATKVIWQLESWNATEAWMAMTVDRCIDYHCVERP